MTNKEISDSDKHQKVPSRSDDEAIIRHLEQFSVEVLEAALLVLRSRGAKVKR